MQPRLALGQRLHAVLVNDGSVAAAAAAREAGQPAPVRPLTRSCEEPVPSFLHSALCAMSLPVRRPADEQAPLIRRDGQYTLMITPKPVIEETDGVQRPLVLGMPYGSLPRLILIHVMTAALRDRSRQVLLGASFADWMRRMGFRTISYGPRGSATLIRQQLDRLLACEWMIRWDSANGRPGEREFGIKEIKLTNEWVGLDRRNSFSREIYLTEAFYNHLQDHAVPLDECAIRQLRDSATALDLYTWLAYRLPRITAARPVILSWAQLAAHFGNDRADIRKFRYSLREAWERQVSAVYPAARAEFDTKAVRLYPSPAPLERKLLSIACARPAATDDLGTPPPVPATWRRRSPIQPSGFWMPWRPASARMTHRRG